ncbi:hypothetical protein Tco_1409987, partial [Tanacetum coccineum]
VANVDLSPVVGGVGVGVYLQGFEHVEMLAQSALGHDRDHDDLYSDDQAFFPTMGDEIEKKLFPLEEWEQPHAPTDSILQKEIIKDPIVCKNALNRTLTPAELVKVEGMSPIELSDRISVLTALIISHGPKLNVQYTSLAHQLLDFKQRLRTKWQRLTSRNKKLKKSNESLSDMVKKLNDQLVEAKELERKLDFYESETQKYKDMAVDAEERVKNLQNDVTRFLRVDLDHLVQKLLTSDEFNVAFANILTLAINSGIERGICMDLTDIQF